MKPITPLQRIALALSALLAAACLGISRALGMDHPIALANIGEKTNTIPQKLADGAYARYLLLKTGSDANHVALCGAADKPVGNSEDESEAAEGELAVRLWGGKPGTRLVVASEAIAKDADVYTDAGGKVQGEPTAAGTYWRFGKAYTAAAGDGSLFEIMEHPPIKVVVLAAETQDSLTDSTGGTADTTLAAVGDTSAGDESGTINNNFADIAAQLAKIKNDIAALGHTSAAETKRL